MKRSFILLFAWEDRKIEEKKTESKLYKRGKPKNSLKSWSSDFERV